MGEEKKAEIVETNWLTVPKGTGFFTGPPPVGEFVKEVEESQGVEYFPDGTKSIRGILWHYSTEREWFSQESSPLGEGDKKRFLNQFGTPIGPTKKKEEGGDNMAGGERKEFREPTPEEEAELLEDPVIKKAVEELGGEIGGVEDRGSEKQPKESSGGSD